jgi:hypothetical protein
MNLTAATIAVYVIGLANFHERTTGGRDVILPLTPAGTFYQGKELEPHHADVVIRGVTKADCRKLKGKWPYPEGANPMCTVSNVSHQSIILPSSTDGFSTTGNFNRIPQLKRRLCAGLADLPPADISAAKHAALLTITNGKLDACTNGDAWVSTLTMTFDAPGKLGIGEKEVTVGDGAVVAIMNAPMGSGGTHEQHFWWYYVLYKDSGACGAPAGHGLPELDRAACTDPVLASFLELDSASGVGCPNTGYP